jgi:hypothetical protein
MKKTLAQVAPKSHRKNPSEEGNPRKKKRRENLSGCPARVPKNPQRNGKLAQHQKARSGSRRIQRLSTNNNEVRLLESQRARQQAKRRSPERSHSYDDT